MPMSANNVVQVYQQELGRAPNANEIAMAQSNPDFNAHNVRQSDEAIAFRARQHSGGNSSRSSNLRDLVDGAVDPRTGQQLVGWRHPRTGRVSSDPRHGFGEGSIPIWGSRDRQDGQRAALRQAYELYDTQANSFGTGTIVGVPIEDWNNRKNVDNRWIKEIRKGERFQMAKDADGNPIVRDGRYLFQQHKKQGGGLAGAIDKAFGTNVEHFLTESLPSDLSGAIAFSMGSLTSSLISPKFYAQGLDTVAGVTGAKTDEIAMATTTVERLAATVVGTVYGGPAGAALASTLYAGAETARDEISGTGGDWGDLAITAGINAVFSSGYANIAANATRAKLEGADWYEVAEAAGWATLGAYAGQEFGTRGEFTVAAARALQADDPMLQLAMIGDASVRAYARDFAGNRHNRELMQKGETDLSKYYWRKGNNFVIGSDDPIVQRFKESFVQFHQYMKSGERDYVPLENY